MLSATAGALFKGIELSVFSQHKLDFVAGTLNTRSRKSLAFTYPTELFLLYTFKADDYCRISIALET